MVCIAILEGACTRSPFSGTYDPRCKLLGKSCQPLPLSLFPYIQVFFTKDWLTLVEASFRNFVAEAIQHLPPPALLRFDTDRLQRSALQKQVDSLQTENAGLRQQLAVRGSSESSQVPAAIAQQGKQHRSQDKRAAIPETAAKPAHSRALFQQQQPPQPQQHVRTLPGQTAAYTMPAGLPHEHSQSTDLDSIQQGPASETSQWVLADGTQKEPLSRLQDAPSDISAQDIPAEDSQQALSLSNADLQPTWSASFTSLDANLLAENSSGTLSQLGAAGDDTLSLDTEASSPRMVRQDPQRQAEMSQAQSDVSSVQPLAGPASIRHHQHEAAGEFVQPATPTQQNGSSQHLSQHVAINSRSTGGSERGPRAAQRQASSGATLNGTASAEQLASHEQGITCCSFSPSGQNLATASSDGVLRISAPTTLQVQLLSLIGAAGLCSDCIATGFTHDGMQPVVLTYITASLACNADLVQVLHMCDCWIAGQCKQSSRLELWCSSFCCCLGPAGRQGDAGGYQRQRGQGLALGYQVHDFPHPARPSISHSS